MQKKSTYPFFLVRKFLQNSSSASIPHPNPIRYKTWIFLSLFIWLLSGCNMPAISGQANPTMNVTQAYQTVEARLTQAVSDTQLPIETPPLSFTPTIGTLAPTATTQPILSITPPNTATSLPTKACDLAGAGNPIDVTIPDDSEMTPGQTFTKIWRLQNTGSCTWTSAYSIAVFSGERMNAPASVPLPGNVEPGQTIDIAVDLVAPQQPGTYQGNWKLRNASQVWFGIGPLGSDAFWVRIKVKELATLTPTQSEASATVTPAVQASGTKTLIPGDSLNLDNNQLNSGDGDDVHYMSGDNGQRLLVPINSALMGTVFGPQQPSFGDCQASSMGISPVILNNLSTGLYICYKSNLNLTGWLLLDNYNEDNSALTLTYLTWITP